MEGIVIIPIGKIDSEVLRDIANALKEAFHCEVEINKGISIPQDALNTRRRQYHSTTILKKIKSIKPENFNRVLSVIDVDLYVPELNFVFGEADIYSGVTVISLKRLRQEFYGLRPDKGLFHLRAIKEAIHEIGHTYGLDHCQNPKCIMYFSNTLRDTDNKGPGFCNTCLSLLEDYLVV
ncbi:MAG: archaemetzincin family Zn-dependent metalloprotease [Thermodesulfovibrionales bacterium]|nr:archaemetzincin family Zn-dependent metalloprotease [Thermodesulfovibrionales bacterium]